MNPRTAMPTSLLAACLPVLGCASTGSTQPALTRNQPQPPRQASVRPIIADGKTNDWPGQGDLRVIADDNHLWIRFDPADGSHAIQAAPFTTRLLVDSDNNASTGRRIGTLGVDAMVSLSPPNGFGGIGIGSEVVIYDAAGNGDVTGHADLGFFFLPTFASSSYEARFDRDSIDGLNAPGRITVRVDQIEADGTERWARQIAANLPRSASNPTGNAAFPIKPANGIRVLAQNVLFSSPLSNPDAFDRMITAIDPDVILFQEWFNTPQIIIQNWFNTNLGPGWTVIAPDPDEGVAIATRMPILETVRDLIDVPGGRRNSRFVGALIDTPIGPFFGASIHLKCCGGANSTEDQRRNAEAIAINATVADVLQNNPDAFVTIAGDYNLVGTRTPLDIIAGGLASDGTSLTPAPTITLGDTAAVTWVDENSRFSPGRLDWAVVDETRTSILRSFTLDTRRLSKAALQASGLQTDDSKASDHLPIVVDLVPAD